MGKRHESIPIRRCHMTPNKFMQADASRLLKNMGMLSNLKSIRLREPVMDVTARDCQIPGSRAGGSCVDA